MALCNRFARFVNKFAHPGMNFFAQMKEIYLDAGFFAATG
jgi:hypothetical protein